MSSQRNVPHAIGPDGVQPVVGDLDVEQPGAQMTRSAFIKERLDAITVG